MTAQQIRALGPALASYLDEFADCFVRPDTRGHIQHYVRGQLSNLPRKSIEPNGLPLFCLMGLDAKWATNRRMESASTSASGLSGIAAFIRLMRMRTPWRWA